MCLFPWCCEWTVLASSRSQLLLVQLAPPPLSCITSFPSTRSPSAAQETSQYEICHRACFWLYFPLQHCNSNSTFKVHEAKTDKDKSKNRQIHNQSWKKNFVIYLFLERGAGREEERERNIDVWLPLTRPLLGTWPATQACALTGNQISSLLVQMPVLEPLQPGQSWKF